MIPGMTLLFIFSYAPMYGLVLAFKEYDFRLGIMRSPWVGLKYMSQVFSFSGHIGVALRNTLFLNMLNIVFGFPAPILFALLLNEITNITYKRVVQTISYLPHFLSWVVVSVLIVDFFALDKGFISVLLRALGSKPIAFLYDSRWFVFILVTSGIWKSVGWGAIIYFAAIANIDVQLYDAAIVDGASRFQRAIHITLPGMMIVISLFLILTIGSLFNSNFAQIFNLMNPAVYNIADVLDTYIYRQGIQQFEYSLTTAVGLLRNSVQLMLILLANMAARRVTEFAIW